MSFNYWPTRSSLSSGAHSTADDADRQLVREVLNEFHVIRVLSLNTANEVVGDGYGPLASSRFEVRSLWT